MRGDVTVKYGDSPKSSKQDKKCDLLSFLMEEALSATLQ